MPSSPDNQDSQFIQVYQQDDRAVAVELSAGLLAEPAQISPKYFYNALGSKLFEAICALPEYYPTRIENTIFDRYLCEMQEAIGKNVTLVDLGAGNCAKAARLFDVLQPRQYVPVDISVDFLREAVGQLKHRYPNVNMLGIGLDFSNGLELSDAVQREQRLFFYPGSSIGNFTPMQALDFLRRVREQCTTGQGGLLIGVDLIKDNAVLDAAYDDALGVTAAFNLNVLLHANALLGADFKLRNWRHRGFFNSAQSRVEMHLEARHNVTVSWPGSCRHFAEGERIHTESSYKYTREGFLQLLEQAGFRHPRTWTDKHGWFMVCHAQAV